MESVDFCLGKCCELLWNIFGHFGWHHLDNRSLRVSIDSNKTYEINMTCPDCDRHIWYTICGHRDGQARGPCIIYIFKAEKKFPADICKCTFLDENVWISLNVSLKFVPKVWINDIPALVQMMAWRRRGDKPLSESMVVSLMTHNYVARSQWVKC